MILNDAPANPFDVPMVFLRVGWMKYYAGITMRDPKISGGHSFLKEHGFGHEIFNFKRFGNQVYGYVQPPSKHQQWSQAKFNLDRLGAAIGDESISGVLAVWVASNGEQGLRVVGWYQNATIHRILQKAPDGAERNYNNQECGFFLNARMDDAVLLPTDERIFLVPRGKGGFGQANTWYADNPAIHLEFRTNFLQFIATRAAPSASGFRTGLWHQPDPFLRQKVEKVAVELVVGHYMKLGYMVQSVEKDNVGWDLTVARERIELKLEVKGLSGAAVTVELTPNEYKAMNAHTSVYRLCVVTDALGSPRLRVFEFSPESNRWETWDRETLNVAESVGARCSLE